MQVAHVERAVRGPPDERRHHVEIGLVVIGGQLVGSAIPSESQRFLPFSALQASVTVVRDGALLSPSVAVVMLVGYAVVLIGIGTLLIERRDV